MANFNSLLAITSPCAYATWRDQSAFDIDEKPSASTAADLVVKAFLLNILNPKLTIFFLAFLPRVQAWLRRSFAAAFAGLGVNLALNEK